MTCPKLLERLDAAEARLAHAAATRNARGVAVLWLDQIRRYDPEAVPDALYVDPRNENDPTLLYDVRRNRFHTVIWTQWRNAREEEEDDFDL